MKRQLLLLTILLFAYNSVIADMVGYSDSLRLRVESKNYIVIHFHDWTDATQENRFKMISSDENPFNSNNNYAFIKCIERTTGKILFKKPCPALTKIEISKDEKYIIGLSFIKLWNPYHLVIFSTDGKLIKKRSIECEEAKLDFNTLSKFKEKYKRAYSYLTTKNRIYKTENFYYIDFLGFHNKIGKAWDYLFKYSGNNHLSKNFSESVTNWIYWYYEKSPSIYLIYKSGMIYSISLLDPKQKRIEIKIKE